MKTKEKSFKEEVYAVVRRIPKGEVLTYKQVAEALGRPGASRAVGTALAANEDPRDVPCHRVIRSDGGYGGYRFGGEEAKRRKLWREGYRPR